MSVLTDHRTEGIILKSLDFKEKDRILTVFTPDLGLIPLFAKGAQGRRNRNSQIAVLNRAEFVLSQGRGEFFSLHESKILSPYLSLRKSYEAFQASCSLAQCVLMTQTAEKPAMPLYLLLLSFLQHLPQAASPTNLLSSFQLKTMRSEGIYYLPEVCGFCKSPMENLNFHFGEGYCDRHAPEDSVSFSKLELEEMNELAFTRSLEVLDTVRSCKERAEKVSLFLQHLLHR